MIAFNTDKSPVIDIDGPAVLFEPRGIAVSQLSTDDCTTLPSTTSTNEGIATVPSSTDSYQKATPASLSTSSAKGAALSTTSYGHYIYSFPPTTSTDHGPATFLSTSEGHSKTYTVASGT